MTIGDHIVTLAAFQDENWVKTCMQAARNKDETVLKDYSTFIYSFKRQIERLF